MFYGQKTGMGGFALYANYQWSRGHSSMAKAWAYNDRVQSERGRELSALPISGQLKNVFKSE